MAAARWRGDAPREDAPLRWLPPPQPPHPPPHPPAGSAPAAGRAARRPWDAGTCRPARAAWFGLGLGLGFGLGFGFKNPNPNPTPTPNPNRRPNPTPNLRPGESRVGSELRREARHAAVGVALELRSPSRPPLGGVLLRVRVRVRARVRVKSFRRRPEDVACLGGYKELQLLPADVAALRGGGGGGRGGCASLGVGGLAHEAALLQPRLQPAHLVRDRSGVRVGARVWVRVAVRVGVRVRVRAGVRVRSSATDLELAVEP